jgi:hypothetical protein
VFSTSEHSPHHHLDTGPDVSRELSPAERLDFFRQKFVGKNEIVGRY